MKQPLMRTSRGPGEGGQAVVREAAHDARQVTGGGVRGEEGGGRNRLGPSVFRSGSRSNHLLGYSNSVVDASEGPENVVAVLQAKVAFIRTLFKADCLTRKLDERREDVGSVLGDRKCRRDSIVSQVVFRVATKQKCRGYVFQRVEKRPPVICLSLPGQDRKDGMPLCFISRRPGRHRDPPHQAYIHTHILLLTFTIESPLVIIKDITTLVFMS